MIIALTLFALGVGIAIADAWLTNSYDFTDTIETIHNILCTISIFILTICFIYVITLI